MSTELERRQEKARKRGKYYDPKTKREYPLDLWEKNVLWRSCDGFVMEGAYRYWRRRGGSLDDWAWVIWHLYVAGLSREQVVHYMELFDYPRPSDYDPIKTREELLLEMAQRELAMARGLLGLLGFLWLTDTK